MAIVKDLSGNSPVVGAETHIAEPGGSGGGGAGDASAANQDEQTAVLEDILTAAQDTTPVHVIVDSATSLALGASAEVIGSIANTGFTSSGPTADDVAATGNPVQVAGKFTTTAPTFTDGDTAQLRLSAKGHMIIGGGTADDAAAPASASEYPVPIGGKYNATSPTYTDGDRVQAQFTSLGGLRTKLMASATADVNTFNFNTDSALIINSSAFNMLGVVSLSGVLGPSSTWERMRSIAASFGSDDGVAASEVAGSPFSRISTNTTTTVKSGAGILHKIVINTKGASANIATVYDNTAGSGTVIAIIDTVNLNPQSLIYDLAFATGLTIVTATGTAADITVVYR